MPVETKSALVRPFRKRSRQGCLTCRQHRSKCDEKSPNCGNCSRLNRHCKWGLRASFHLSRIYGLSSSDSMILSEIESGRQHLLSLAFVDETEKIEREYESQVEDSSQLERTRGIVSNTTITTPEYAEGHYPEETGAFCTAISGPQKVQHSVTFRNEISEVALEMLTGDSQASIDSEPVQSLYSQSPPIPDRPIYSASNNISLVQGFYRGARRELSLDSSSQGVLAWPINDHIKAGLLSAYFQTTSRWCEVTDSSKPFSTLWSHLVTESQAFAAAAAALACTTRPRRNDASCLLTRELYSFACEVLNLKLEHHEGTLLATTLLCLCCSALEKPIEEQSTLNDCADLFQSTTSNKVSAGVLSACFWAFLRQDIWAAHLSGRSTLIPIDTWNKIGDLALHNSAQDNYSNQAICITARIMNELSKENVGLSPIALQNIWAELQTWVIERPPAVRCIMEVEASGDLPFPTILFSNPSAVCGNIYYHAASILLLATGQISDDLSAIASPICHARRIAGISITNNEHANLVNNINALNVAARYLPTSVEKIAILKHLEEIEDWTGWRTKRHVLDLKRLWHL